MKEILLDRLRDHLLAKKIEFEEKKMFGGVAMMIHGHMSCGITNKGKFMVRIDPVDQEMALTKKGARMMDFTGRPMKGFLYVEDEGLEKDGSLNFWLDLTLKYIAVLPVKVKEKAKAKSKGK